MAKRSEQQYELSELSLFECAIPDCGWVGDRTCLPLRIEKLIRALLLEKLPEDQIDRLVSSLRRGFSKAVELGRTHHQLQSEVITEAQNTGRKKRPPKKLGVLLRDYVRSLRLVLSKAAKGERRIALDEIIRDIERFEVLDQLVTLQLEERFDYEIVDPLRASPERSAELLAQVLKDLEASIDAGVQSGPVEPSQEFLANYLVYAFFEETGNNLGRTWDPYENKEKGMGFKICRLLAISLHFSLPKETRPSRSFRMAKTYRNAIQHRAQLRGSAA